MSHVLKNFKYTCFQCFRWFSAACCGACWLLAASGACPAEANVGVFQNENEGFLTFYKGFSASFTRLVAWNVCLWLTYEQLKKGVLAFYKS